MQRVALGVTWLALALPALSGLLRLWVAQGRVLPWALLLACLILGLVLARRDAPLPWSPPLPPWPCYLGGLAALALGARAGEARVAGYGLVVASVGALGLTRGGRAVARLWPLAALALIAIPLPTPPSYAAVALGKGLVGAAAATLLTLAGVPTALDGWILDVGGHPLRLVDACSGARTQAGLIAATTVLLCLRPHPPRVRLALLAACVPAALIASTARVALVGACYALGPRAWADAVHTAVGVAAVLPGVGLVVATGWVVGLHAPPEPAPSPLPRAPAGVRGSSLALIAALAASCLAWAPRAAPAAHPPRLPTTLEGRSSRPAPDEPLLAEALRVDRVELRQYGPDPRTSSSALLVHARRLEAPHDVFSHAPEVCHRVFGWTVLAERDVDLGRWRVRELEVAQGERARVVHFAYLDPEGHAEPSLLWAWLDALAAGARGASTARSLLLLSSGDLPAPSPADLEAGRRRCRALLRAVAGPPVGERSG